jgi:hypothetical protein
MPSFSTVNSWAVRKSGSKGLGERQRMSARKGDSL